MRFDRLVKTLFFSCAALSGASLAAQGAPPAVTVTEVIELQETGIRTYIGRLDAMEDVTLPARVSGKIMKYHFKEGDFVKKGDLLIELEDDTYVAAVASAAAQLSQADAQIKQAEAQIKQAQAQIKQAHAQVKQAEANLKYAKDAFDRADKLREVDAEKAHDAAVRDLNLAEAQKSAAEGALAAANAAKAAAEGNLAAAHAAKASAAAALKNAQINLSYTKITAPFDGKIGKTTYSVGNYVTPSSGSLAQLTQFDPIYVKFAISEPDLIRGFGTVEALKKDALVRIKLSDNSLYAATATITITDNKIDQSTGTLMLWAKIDNKDLRLTPGAVVEVLLSRKVQEKKPAVPISAIQISPKGQFVYVLNPANNQVFATPVVPGEIIGGMQIVNGLTPGQIIVIDGMHKIIPIPGQPSIVTPVRK